MTNRRRFNGAPKGHTRNIGKLQKRYRFVPANTRRVLWRPYVKPPRLYLITAAGVFLCAPASFDKAKLAAKGYTVNKDMTHKNQVVMERVIGQ